MTIDIAFSLNQTLQEPLLVVINSILSNVSEPSDSVPGPLRFNVVVPPGDRTLFQDSFNTTFAAAIASGEAIFRIEEFTPPDYLKEYLDEKFKAKTPLRKLSRYMQYGRLFLSDLFPDVGRVIYLDCDTLVLGDVRSLYAQGEKLTPERYLAAVPHFFPAALYFSNPFNILSDLRQFESTFNSGVLLIDLTYWTEETYNQLKHYLALDTEHNRRLFQLGDETVFNLMFKSYVQLDSSWNACGFGQGHFIAGLMRKPVEKMNIIHWSGGHHKPWEQPKKSNAADNGVIYADLWRKYLPQTV